MKFQGWVHVKRVLIIDLAEVCKIIKISKKFSTHEKKTDWIFHKGLRTAIIIIFMMLTLFFNLYSRFFWLILSGNTWKSSAMSSLINRVIKKLNHLTVLNWNVCLMNEHVISWDFISLVHFWASSFLWCADSICKTHV